MKSLKKLKKFYDRYERYLIPGALIFGFITDVLTFRLVDFNFAMVLLLGHLVFVGTNISIINLYREGLILGKFFSYWRLLAPLFLQYSFGNLFSAFLIFYSHSGSFSASWPFIAVIIFLMIGNEVFRKYNVRPAIHISVYFFAIFSYLNLILPYIFKDLSVFMFVLSGIFSLAIATVFVFTLSAFVSGIKEKRKTLSVSIGSIFLAMNFLYFFNLIPPIPLSIKEIGIYHHIERVNDGYRVETEKCFSWDRCFFSNEQRHIHSERGVLYLYTAVYAPHGMSIGIENEWQRYDEEQKKWQTKAIIPFDIAGGREIGYRWYSYYTVYPGYWRVNVKTERGQTVGRKNFIVIQEKEAERNTIII